MKVENKDLSKKLDDVAVGLELVHAKMEIEGKKRDRRIRTNKILVGLTIVLAVIGIWTGISGKIELNQAKQNNQTARINSCLQYNKQQDVIIAAQIAESHDLVNALAAGNHAPDVDEQVAAFNKRHDGLITKSYPLRDCSPEGIEKYLNPEK